MASGYTSFLRLIFLHRRWLNFNFGSHLLWRFGRWCWRLWASQTSQTLPSNLTKNESNTSFSTILFQRYPRKWGIFLIVERRHLPLLGLDLTFSKGLFKAVYSLDSLVSFLRFLDTRKKHTSPSSFWLTKWLSTLKAEESILLKSTVDKVFIFD